MTARYLLTMTDRDAGLLERWLGGEIHIGPGEAPIVAVPVAGLDAITDEEYEVIAGRLRSSGPIYHAGGPGAHS